MRTWHRTVLATGSLTIAALLTGCTAGGTATGPATPDRSIVAEPSSAAPTSTPPASPTTGPGPTTAMPAGSGVSGLITVDGGCPVATDPPCPDRPYPARITITSTHPTDKKLPKGISPNYSDPKKTDLKYTVTDGNQTHDIKLE